MAALELMRSTLAAVTTCAMLGPAMTWLRGLKGLAAIPLRELVVAYTLLEGALHLCLDLRQRKERFSFKQASAHAPAPPPPLLGLRGRAARQSRLTRDARAATARCCPASHESSGDVCQAWRRWREARALHGG